MVIYLPAHMSYISQLLDKGLFEPLKQFYSQEVALSTFVPGTAPINKQLIIEAYKHASEKAFNSFSVANVLQDSPSNFTWSFSRTPAISDRTILANNVITFASASS